MRPQKVREARVPAPTIGQGAEPPAVRPAGPADVPAIYRLIRELAAYERAPDEVTGTEDDLRRSLFGPQPAVFAHVAEHQGRVAGFALWFLNYSTWLGRHGIYLEDLYVTPDQRGRGFGKALIAELAAICVARDYGRLEWWVLDWNEPARGFYASLGAIPMDEWTVHRLTGQALRDLAAARLG
jgi:GNAT superfamily N-acetyltransferase